ncbi:MAG TPA: PAS domain-containing protein [Nevskiaceae bacterium]|nr:PAS domain-containing protein [Nevskiaceae bacterium]
MSGLTQVNVARVGPTYAARIEIGVFMDEGTDNLAARGRQPPPSASLPVPGTLPISAAALESTAAAVYHAAARGDHRGELLRMLCVELGKRCGAALVMIGRKAANGTVAIDAESTANALALAFTRVPECWDGGVASQGAATSALRAGGPVRMRFASEPLALWRSAALQDGIAEMIAVPIAVGTEVLVLELFYAAPAPTAAASMTIDAFCIAIEHLLEDLGTIERQRLVARALEQSGNAAFITNAHGSFVWTNPAFQQLSGYSEAEVLGRDPRLLQSGKQGLRYYRELWSRIRSGKVWSGETIDRDKSGRLYTIRQTVSPLVEQGRITHYVSIHEDIGAQKRKLEALELATAVDPRTGLLTRAAFEAAARDALSTLAAQQNGADLVVLSLRGLRRASESFDAEIADFLGETMGRRVREALPPPHLVSASSPYEYTALVQHDQLSGGSVQTLIEEATERLSEPLLYLGNALEIDARCVRATYPDAGTTLEELVQSADRKLADEPVARARPIRAH